MFCIAMVRRIKRRQPAWNFFEKYRAAFKGGALWPDQQAEEHAHVQAITERWHERILAQHRVGWGVFFSFRP